MDWTVYHWIREWSAPVHQTMWIELQTIATVCAFGAAYRYVVLTSRLLRESAANRETDLMLRLINEYDGLREAINVIQAYFRDCASPPTDPLVRFRDSFQPGGSTQWPVDDSRFKVSRFFVRVRKLAQAGYLSERVIIAALDPEAIEQVFLALVDPLDEAKAGPHYKRADHDFFETLLKRYTPDGVTFPKKGGA